MVFNLKEILKGKSRKKAQSSDKNANNSAQASSKVESDIKASNQEPKVKASDLSLDDLSDLSLEGIVAPEVLETSLEANYFGRKKSKSKSKAKAKSSLVVKNNKEESAKSTQAEQATQKDATKDKAQQDDQAKVQQDASSKVLKQEKTLTQSKSSKKNKSKTKSTTQVKVDKIELSRGITLVTKKAKPQKASVINRYNKVAFASSVQTQSSLYVESKAETASILVADHKQSQTVTKEAQVLVQTQALVQTQVQAETQTHIQVAKQEAEDLSNKNLPKKDNNQPQAGRKVFRAINDTQNPYSARYQPETVTFKHVNLKAKVTEERVPATRKVQTTEDLIEESLRTGNFAQDYAAAKEEAKQDSWAYKETELSFSHTLEQKEEVVASPKKKDSFADLFTDVVKPVKTKKSKGKEIPTYHQGSAGNRNSARNLNSTASNRVGASVNSVNGFGSAVENSSASNTTSSRSGSNSGSDFSSLMANLGVNKKFADDTVDLSRDRARAKKYRNIQAGIPSPKRIVEEKAIEELRKDQKVHVGNTIDIQFFTKDNYHNASYRSEKLSATTYGYFKKGRIASDIIEVDLHKNTVEESKRAIFNVIAKAMKGDCCIIKIITGHGQEILKEKVPNYLITLEEVLAFIPKKDASNKTNGFLVLIDNLDKKYQ